MNHGNYSLKITSPHGYNSHPIEVTIKDISDQNFVREITLNYWLEENEEKKNGTDTKNHENSKQKLRIELYKGRKLTSHLGEIDAIIREFGKFDSIPLPSMCKLYEDLQKEIRIINSLLLRLDPKLILRSQMDLSGHMQDCKECKVHVKNIIEQYTLKSLEESEIDSDFDQFYESVVNHSN